VNYDLTRGVRGGSKKQTREGEDDHNPREKTYEVNDPMESGLLITKNHLLERLPFSLRLNWTPQLGRGRRIKGDKGLGSATGRKNTMARRSREHQGGRFKKKTPMGEK